MSFGSVPPVFYVIGVAIVICFIIYGEYNSRS